MEKRFSTESFKVERLSRKQSEKKAEEEQPTM